MAHDTSQSPTVRSRGGLFLLLGVLAAALIVYLYLPRTWFHPPETPSGRGPSTQPARKATPSLEELRAAAANSPQDFGARSRYGMALFSQGKKAESLAEFRAAASLVPESPVVHHNLGIYYMSIGQPAAADAEFARELEITPGSGSAHFYRGQALIAQHKDMESIRQLKLAIALAPDYAEPYLTLAGQVGELQPAGETMKLIDEYVRRGGDKYTADFIRSRVYRAQHQYAEAAKYGELTVKANPNSYANWHNLGQIYSYARKFPEADAALKRAVDLAKDKSTAYIELGMNSQSEGKVPEAIELFKKALEANPRTGNIHIYLARAYESIGDHDTAKREEAAYREWNKTSTGFRPAPGKKR